MYETTPPRYVHVFCFPAKMMMLMMFEVTSRRLQNHACRGRTTRLLLCSHFPPRPRPPQPVPSVTCVRPLSRQNPHPFLPAVCHIGLRLMVSVVRLSILNVFLSLAVFVPFNADRPTGGRGRSNKSDGSGFIHSAERGSTPPAMEFRTRLEQTDMTSSFPFSFFLCDAMWS